MKLKDTPCEKSYDQPKQHVKKLRHYFTNKVHLVKAMVFPVVMYGCKSWTIKNAEHWRLDAFELWCWRRLLRVPWTARRSNQSILKELRPGCSLEGWCWSWNSNTLATSCEGLTHWKRLWSWEGLRAGEGDDRGWDGWMALLTRWTWVWVNSGGRWWTGRPVCCDSWCHKESDTTERLNWTEHKYCNYEITIDQFFLLVCLLLLGSWLA